MTDALPDGALSATAARRNAAAILSVLRRIAPAQGRVLEIAAGTGEHAITFAPALPGLTWQPTDPDPARRASITAWAQSAPAPNLLPPRDLDAARPGWAADHGPVELIFLANLLHLISEKATETVLSELALALAPGGIAAIYGPFLRDGETTSDGDAAFHAQLQANNPEIGYKDVIDIAATLTGHGLHLVETVRMPANNLLLCFERRA